MSPPREDFHQPPFPCWRRRRRPVLRFLAWAPVVVAAAFLIVVADLAATKITAAEAAVVTAAIVAVAAALLPAGGSDHFGGDLRRLEEEVHLERRVAGQPLRVGLAHPPPPVLHLYTHRGGVAGG